MTERRRWRVQTLAVTTVGGLVLMGLVALAATFLAFAHLTGENQVRQARQEAGEVATSLAAQTRGGLTERSLRAQSGFFADEHVVVRTPAGLLEFGSPLRGRSVTVTAPGPAGTSTTVSVTAPVEAETALSLALTAITAGVLLLLGLVATLVTWRATGRLRHRLERASSAAERLSAGDLSVRVGEGGPAEMAALGHAIDSMAARLAASDLEQRQFLTDLAHEIATPFQIVAGLAEALLDGTVAPTDDLDAGEVVAQETARLSRLLDDLRAVTRADLTPAAVPTDLAALAANLVDRFTTLAVSSGLAISASSERANAVTDPHLVETVISNFVTNAMRSTPSGGEVVVAVRRSRGRVRISVTDTGMGIPADEQERIFDRFYRLDRARDRAAGGAGLGLSIARRYALALGGWIELESTPGKGSRFTLVIPSAPGDPVEPMAPARDHATEPAPPRL